MEGGEGNEKIKEVSMRKLLVVVLCACLAVAGFCVGSVEGYKAGERSIFNAYGNGQAHLTNLSIVYNSLHNTPWQVLTIQDKMFLCAYGSSGNKLNKQDLAEITKRYGVN